MLFLMEDSWEYKSPEIREHLGQHIKSYKIIELLANATFFIVEVKTNIINTDQDENDNIFQKTRTFLIDSIYKTLITIKDPDIIDHNINLFVPRNSFKCNEPSVTAIEEIYLAKDSSGNEAHVFLCRNGFKYVETHFKANENDLISKERIYKKTNHDFQ